VGFLHIRCLISIVYLLVALFYVLAKILNLSYVKIIVMTKTQIITTTVIASLIVAVGMGAILYFLVDNQFNKISQNNLKTNSYSATAPDTIPLTDNSSQQNSSALSVNDTANNSANLGSGTSKAKNTQNNNTSQEDFSQYAQYKDKSEVFFGEIKEGNGTVAQKDSQLAVTYVGYLTDGSVFDQSKSSNGQKEPLLFKLGAGQLIPGFEQGVAGMKVGGQRRVIIPPSLGYGDKAQGSIPANSVLIFDIQLLASQ
jgi:FKBP-type peptidyl-prolyl cis-trans isomerase